jgi:hypothetical protein
MEHPLRRLRRPVLLAATLTAALVVWIRVEPLAMPPAAQMALTLALVAVAGALPVLAGRGARGR